MFKTKSINSGKKVELVLAIQSKGGNFWEERKMDEHTRKVQAVGKDLRNGCNLDLSLNRRGREKRNLPIGSS